MAVGAVAYTAFWSGGCQAFRHCPHFCPLLLHKPLESFNQEPTKTNMTESFIYWSNAIVTSRDKIA
jgi:hypothetical protein